MKLIIPALDSWKKLIQRIYLDILHFYDPDRLTHRMPFAHFSKVAFSLFYSEFVNKSNELEL